MKQLLLIVTAILVLSTSGIAQNPPAKASDTPKPATPVSSPVPVPQPESAQITALITEAAKLDADFNAKVQALKTELLSKMAPLQKQFDVLMVQAAAKSGIGLTELGKMSPVTENGVLVWKVREVPKEK